MIAFYIYPPNDRGRLDKSTMRVSKDKEWTSLGTACFICVPSSISHRLQRHTRRRPVWKVYLHFDIWLQCNWSLYCIKTFFFICLFRCMLVTRFNRSMCRVARLLPYVHVYVCFLYACVSVQFMYPGSVYLFDSVMYKSPLNGWPINYPVFSLCVFVSFCLCQSVCLPARLSVCLSVSVPDITAIADWA